MSDRKQAVIPDSTCGVDAAAYAIGRNHKGNPPAKLGGIKANMGLGRRSEAQPRETPKFKTYRG